MKNRGILQLSAFGALMLAVALACGSPTTPTSPTVAPAPTQEAVTAASSTESSGGLVTWTDQNKYFSIDVPADWKHSQEVDSQSNNWYWDTIQAPDGHAQVESVVYDDGTAWTGTQSGKMALVLLNQFYSNTGKEGDIRVSNDSIQKDGSERLTWASKGGNYSGVSFFEVRKKTAFLMFTIKWDNAYSDQYQKVLDDVVSSYK